MIFTYLLLNLFTFAGPAAMSFEPKIRFIRLWKPAFKAITIVAIFFLAWDYVFTVKKIWAFNPDFLIGWYVGVLPVEEILFFFTVPFACLFIYEVVTHYLPEPGGNDLLLKAGMAWGIILILIALFNLPLTYTAVKLLLTGAFLLYITLFLKPEWFSRFVIMYGFHLIPFFIVNGILTALPVVTYNDYFNLGIRIGTIPIEDTQYSLLLLLMNVVVYEHYKRTDVRL